MSEGSPSSRLDVLRENERTLRRHIADAEPQVVAALARELRMTVREIAELEAQSPKGQSVADEIAAKRRRKLAAPGGALAAGGVQPRRRQGRNTAG